MTPTKRRRALPKWPERTSPSAAAITDDDDLLTEILLRLPAESLLRSKRVSRRWYSLITDSRFSLLWSKPKSVSGLFLRRLSLSAIPKFDYLPLDDRNSSGRPFTSFDFVDDPQGIDILQSCNGLLLCCSFRLRNHSWKYYIYNPTTTQFTSLPRPIGFEKKIVRGLSFAFDPSKSPHYKVVCVCSHSVLLSGFYWVQIYSSETHTWKAYEDVVIGPFDMVFDKGVFWNGSINWLSCKSETSLCFNSDQECIKTIPMPPIGEGENERTSGYFGGSRGHLHLIVFCGNYTTQFDVLEMEPDYSKWFVKYRVDIDAVITSFADMQPRFSHSLDNREFSVLCVLGGEIEDESSLVIYVPGMAFYYNFKNKSVMKVADVMVHGNYECFSPYCKSVVGHQYIESVIRV